MGKQGRCKVNGQHIPNHSRSIAVRSGCDLSQEMQRGARYAGIKFPAHHISSLGFRVPLQDI